MPEATPVRTLDTPSADGYRVLSDPDLDYADGAEGRLAEIVASVSDISSSSRELADAATDWGTEYSLVPTRSNVMRSVDLKPHMRVLEIGCGCGPITRYLGEKCATVDAIEPMAARAKVASLRTRDLSSVQVFVGTLDDVPAEEAYDVVVVIGVLEYVGQGTASPAPYLRFLEQCHAVLRPGGTLVLAIENPLGVKYIAGAVEDHSNRPFDSLEDYVLTSPARTFTRATLASLLADAGFSSSFLSAFPDYKLPRAVMADALFRRSAQLAETLPRFPSPDYLVPRMNLADEALTWRTLVASGVAEHFANSFITLATKGSGPSLWPEDRLALLFNSERQPHFAVRSEIHDVAGRLVVQRAPLHEGFEATSAGSEVDHRIVSTEDVAIGRSLVRVLLEEPGRRPELLKRWTEMVPDSDDAAPVDLVPHNIVVTADCSLVAIDQEWFVRDYGRANVLLRGIVLTALQMPGLTRPQQLAPWVTVIDAVRALADEAGVDCSDAALLSFFEVESRFQSAVNTTDVSRSARMARSKEDLAGMLELSLAQVRGGERFDIQWARAAAELADHGVLIGETRAQLNETRERSAAEVRDALARADAARAEVDWLERRTLAGFARRVVRRLRRLAS